MIPRGEDFLGIQPPQRCVDGSTEEKDGMKSAFVSSTTTQNTNNKPYAAIPNPGPAVDSAWTAETAGDGVSLAFPGIPAFPTENQTPMDTNVLGRPKMGTEPEHGDDLEDRVTSFLERNFPQIWMHGGTAAIEELDPETGEVSLRLGGACSGCGISPMTVQAIKSRMAKEIPEIQTVHANAMGMGQTQSSNVGGASRGQSADEDDSDLPF